ncbi:MAG: hypothetical protein QN183_09055 [Armatimonadota bacterium]|nr:hypothetical protein [Armatimonadota bacterium]MDR7533379.1 hypothetical protein [Armatimonadota bacterium]MDR7536499.1 hypothetical protein [Armatimonadota bacterium]
MASDRRVDRLEHLMERIEAAVARLAEAQVRTEERLARLEEAVARLAEAQVRTEERLAVLRGHDLQRRYTENAPAYFQRLLRQPRLVPKEELGRLADSAEDRGVLSAFEREQLLWTDVVVLGRRRTTGEETYLAVEVSATVDSSDVLRAADRARLLQRATGLPAIAAAAGEGITPEAERQAARLGVWRVLDGRTYAPDEAHPDTPV